MEITVRRWLAILATDAVFRARNCAIFPGWFGLVCLLILALSATQSRAQGVTTETSRKVSYYKSTMMAGEISSNPAKDSMGMDMVPVFDDAATREPGIIRIDPSTQQNIGLRTAPVTTGPLERTIRTVGSVDYDEASLTDVSVKYPGWIEKLFADTTGKQVHKGDPLFEIYAPELYGAQAEYVSSMEIGATQKGVALQKLKNFDISQDQLAELEKTHQLKKSLRIDSPGTGIIIEKSAVQGMRVETGERLYRLADLSSVWLLAQVYEQDVPFIEPGQEAVAVLSYYPGREFRGRITYIYPSVDEKTRTTKVRLEFHNPGYFLKPGMFANVTVRSVIKPSVLLVPEMAVLRSGEKNTVFVALEGGRFEPRRITLGQRSGDERYEVLDGLRQGERVVVSAQFLLDSESQLQEAVQKMLSITPVGVDAETSPSSETRPATGHQHAEPATEGGVSKASENTERFVCPIPEHSTIVYLAPGNCPICTMPLIPADSSPMSLRTDNQAVLYYTCPMPEHSDVRRTTPGRCPRCGMTLISVARKPDDAPTTQSLPESPITTSGTLVNENPAAVESHAGHNM